MEKENKTKLMQEAQNLADKHEDKKTVIKTALDELDSKKKVGQEHLRGMAIIDELFNELDLIENEQIEIFEKIKKI